MGTSHCNIKSMSYSDELIEQMISFLFSFRLFCFILFLESTFFLFVNLFIYFATTIILQCGQKLSRVGKIITGLYLSYPGQANFSNISLQNEASRLHERQKVGLARMVIRLALSPFFDGRFNLLAHINPFARPAGSTLSRRALF